MIIVTKIVCLICAVASVVLVVLNMAITIKRQRDLMEFEKEIDRLKRRMRLELAILDKVDDDLYARLCQADNAEYSKYNEGRRKAFVEAMEIVRIHKGEEHEA